MCFDPHLMKGMTNSLDGLTCLQILRNIVLRNEHARWRANIDRELHIDILLQPKYKGGLSKEQFVSIFIPEFLEANDPSIERLSTLQSFKINTLRLHLSPHIVPPQLRSNPARHLLPAHSLGRIDVMFVL